MQFKCPTAYCRIEGVLKNVHPNGLLRTDWFWGVARRELELVGMVLVSEIVKNLEVLRFFVRSLAGVLAISGDLVAVILFASVAFICD